VAWRGRDPDGGDFHLAGVQQLYPHAAPALAIRRPHRERDRPYRGAVSPLDPLYIREKGEGGEELRGKAARGRSSGKSVVVARNHYQPATASPRQQPSGRTCPSISGPPRRSISTPEKRPSPGPKEEPVAGVVNAPRPAVTPYRFQPPEIGPTSPSKSPTSTARIGRTAPRR